MANKKRPRPAPYTRDDKGQNPSLFCTKQSKVVHIDGDYQSLCGNIRLFNEAMPTRGTFLPIKVKSIPATTPYCELCMSIWNNQVIERKKLV